MVIGSLPTRVSRLVVQVEPVICHATRTTTSIWRVPSVISTLFLLTTGYFEVNTAATKLHVLTCLQCGLGFRNVVVLHKTIGALHGNLR